MTNYGLLTMLLIETVVFFVGLAVFLRFRSFGFRGFGLKPEDLTRHVIVLGRTGSGKTVTTKKIIAGVRKQFPSVVVIDYAGEYADVLPNGTTIHALNPFASGDYSEEYAWKLSSMFHSILQLSEPQTHMLYNAVMTEFEERTRTKAKQPPRISDIVERLRKMAPISKFDFETRLALERRLLPLTFSSSEGMAIGDGNDLRIDVSKLKTREEKSLTALLALHHYYNEAKTQPDSLRA